MTELPGTLELEETEIAVMCWGSGDRAAAKDDVVLLLPLAVVVGPVTAPDNCCGLVRLPRSWFRF